MKKICFIAPKAYQLFNSSVKSTFGGAEVQLSLLAKELARDRELKIHFIVADYGQREFEIHNDVKVWKSFNFKDNPLKQLYSFIKIFNRINADVYIQRTLTMQSGLIALYCKLRNKKFIYMVAHDSEVDQTHTVYKSKLGKFLADLNFKMASKVIVQNLYQNKNLPFPSIILSSSLKISKSAPLNKEYLLWVGRSEDWKRPELFLKLAQSFTRERFVMICPPATTNKKLFEKIKARSNFIPNLKFINFVPFNKMSSYFRKAKVYINTSIQEGFPNTFLQAAAHKTPILSLSVNPNDFLNKFKCGFYGNNNFPLSVRQLKTLIEDKKLYKIMSKNIYKYARDNHNLKKNIKFFSGIINSL